MIGAPMVVLLAMGLVLILVLRECVRPATGDAHPRCGNCRYCLIGLTSDRCPECGALIEEAGIVTQFELAVARRRDRIGALLILFALLFMFLVINTPSS